MDFSERLGQVMHEVWGYDVVGDLGKDGYLEFFPTDTVSEPTVVHCKEGLFSYYEYERGDIGGPVFRSSSLHVMEHCLVQNFGNPLRRSLGFQHVRLARDLKIREGWSLVPVGDGRRPGYLGIRSESGVFYSCRTYRSWLLFCLSFVVEFSPLDVLECYLHPDAGPLLSQWVDREWIPEEDE